MADNVLDQYVHRLQNITTFNIHSVDAKGKVKPWYDVTGEIVKDLVIQRDNLAIQVETISAQIQHWGRLAAQCKRVWEIEERDFRIWRAKNYLELCAPPEESDTVDAATVKAWKKPSEAKIDAMTRVLPDYSKWYARTERAEEAHSAALAVLNGFRSKSDMLKTYAYRNREDGAPRLSV